MALTVRENFLKNASLQGHEWIPSQVSFSATYWNVAGKDLEELCLRHPRLFPGFRKGDRPVDTQHPVFLEERERWTDDWGCVWENDIAGYCGQVVEGPLEDWDAFADWSPPEPPPFTDEDRAAVDAQRERGELVSVGTHHGWLLMRLYYLRGFENFMLDMATEDPRLDELIETVVGYWEKTLLPRIEYGVDVVSAADDQGTQTGSMTGPTYFRRYLLPAYQRIFLPQRERGGHCFMHSDGYIMDIMDELIESGLTIVNPQDLVNGVDELAKHVKGRVCIRLDIDRQSVVPFGTPDDVYELVREEVLKLGSPQGGLEFIIGVYPPTPVENVEAVCSALEDHMTYWVGK